MLSIQFFFFFETIITWIMLQITGGLQFSQISEFKSYSWAIWALDLSFLIILDLERKISFYPGHCHAHGQQYI